MTSLLLAPDLVEATQRPTRIRFEPSRDALRQLVRFTVIGVVMTLAYLVLYVALRGTWGAQGANLIAWVATALADTAANRRLTFGLSGRTGAARAQAEGLLVFGTGMAITSGSLIVLSALVGSPAQWLELGVLVAANLVAGLLRFSLLRHWVFAPHRLRALAAPTTPDGSQEQHSQRPLSSQAASVTVLLSASARAHEETR